MREVKKRELVTASVAGLFVLAVWALGFKFRAIHAAMAGIIAVAIGFLPIQIALGEDD